MAYFHIDSPDIVRVGFAGIEVDVKAQVFEVADEMAAFVEAAFAHRSDVRRAVEDEIAAFKGGKGKAERAPKADTPDGSGKPDAGTGDVGAGDAGAAA